MEHVIREDYNIEALELMELYTETLLARFGLVETVKVCDPGIQEVVNNIIYGAPRVEIKELDFVRDQLISKYGKEFAMAAMENSDNRVNERLVQKLRVSTPDQILVNQYLKTIAAAFDLAWSPPDSSSEEQKQKDVDIVKPLPELKQNYPQQYPQVAPSAIPLQQFGVSAIPQGYNQFDAFNNSKLQQYPQQTVNVQPQQPSTEGLSNFTVIPAGANVTNTTDSSIQQQPIDFTQLGTANATEQEETSNAPDFDELSKRFDALKKRK